jgi:hypothetical protein
MLWRQRGALTLRRKGSDHGSAFVIESARTKNFDRPWAPATREMLAVSSGNSGKTGVREPDATPRQEDIEADQ